MEVKFEIWVRTKQGEIFIAFHWCRDAMSGIARAESEGKKFGYDIEEAWAIATN